MYLINLTHFEISRQTQSLTALFQNAQPDFKNQVIHNQNLIPRRSSQFSILAEIDGLYPIITQEACLMLFKIITHLIRKTSDN